MNDCTTIACRQADHDRLAAELAEFKRRGGKIERLPRGAMVTAGWTPRQRLNPEVLTKAERAARMDKAEAKARNQKMQTQHEERIARRAALRATPAPKQKVERPKPKGLARLKGPKGLQIIAAIRAGHRTAYQIAEHTGQTRYVVSTRLQIMKKMGLVTCKGIPRSRHMTWTVVECP